MENVGIHGRLSAGAVTVTMVAGLALFASSWAGAAKVEPVLLPGASDQGKECADNDGDGQTWAQLKVDPNADGQFTDGTLTVTISNTSQDDKTFDWSSNIAVDAVIAKGGADGSYLYRYDPPSETTSDQGLTTPGENSISHVSFCYDAEQPAQTGTIVVEKQTIPDGYVPPQGGFVFSGELSAALMDGETASKVVPAGTYTVTESLAGRPFWDLISLVCDDANSTGDLQTLTATYRVEPGETVKCTFTNQKRSLIVVKKETNPDGAPGSFTFEATFDPNPFSLSDGEEAVSPQLLPGNYSVTENVPEGWELESATCDNGDDPASIDLPASTIVTCTFVNRQATGGRIVVRKVTDPAGDPESFAFTASYDQDGFSLTHGQSNDSGSLAPGTYAVSETVPVGWDLESAVCSDQSPVNAIRLQAGEVVTCTFTNEKDSRVVVQKVTDPSGSQQAFGFQASYDADGFSLTDGGVNDSGDLDPGTYSVSENVPTGWALASALCSDGSDPDEIDLDAGETVTCIFTNTQGATIIVAKQTTPDGDPAAFAFTGDASGSIGDGGTTIVRGLEPGTYTSTESAIADWTLTAIACDAAGSSGNLGTRTATFQVEAGDVVTCTFFNSKNAVPGRGSIDVQKSADPTSLKEPGGQVTFSVRITNTSTVGVSIQNVVDDKFGDLDDSGGNGCFDVPINLGPNGFATCQFVGQVTGTGGTTHVNVVTASGNDTFGNPVSDSDDARVVITERLIDLVVVKDASSPTPLNGTVNYSLTVSNKGPDTATNAQLADPAPAGITYLTASPSQGTCNLGPALVTCSLGTLAPGQSVTIAIRARATAVGSHTNTATVTGSGGRETNPADNVDTAVTVVPAPLTPPTPKPKPRPTPPLVESEVCTSLIVTPKMIRADGKVDRVVARVVAASKPMKGARVLVRGVGVRKTGRTDGRGVAVIEINPRSPGLITITTLESRRESCGAKRIGVVGIFLPPLTG